MQQKYLELLSLIVDGLVILGTGVCLMLLYPGLPEVGAEYPAAISLFGFIYVLIAQRVALNSFSNILLPLNASRTILGVLVLIFLILVALSFMLKVSEDFSRVWVFSWLITMFFGLVLNRAVLKYFAKNTAARKVAVLGAGDQGQRLLNQLSLSGNAVCEVAGVFDDRAERTKDVVAGHKVLGTTEDLIEFASANQCERILVAMPWSAADRISNIMEKLSVLSIDISLVPDLIASRFPVKYSDDFGLPLFELSRKPLTDLETLFKRAADLIVASIAIVVLSPVFLLTAIAIKLDSKGPVFFIQRRYGFNRQPLMIFKFRSMKIESQDDDGEVLATRDDDRVTRVGNFLRKSSIDELPQLLNVLAGDMSVVGPRPHATKAKAGNVLYREAVEDYAMRYRVKPGITGWAQVNGWRGETDTTEKLEKRVEHDLYYIANWSPLLDVVIIFRTLWVCVTGRNAF